MTQEEFYIWLVNYGSCSGFSLPKFNPEFLKNYEIAKLILEKFGINKLNEIQHKNLNFEAVSAWFRVSEYIKLEYDIPEILELLPERIINYLNLENSQVQFLPQLESVQGNLNLQNSQIQSLPKLETIGGSLYLYGSKIQTLPQLESVGEGLSLRNSQTQSLPQLESVGGGLILINSQIKSLPQLKSVGDFLDLRNSEIKSIPKLKYVKGNLNLHDSQIQSLPKLESVGGWIRAENKLEYWKDYFLQTSRPELAGRVVYLEK